MEQHTTTEPTTHDGPFGLTWGDGGPWILFGGDYNPEQWDRATWEEDMGLMRQAKVNVVNLAIFSWGLLEPEEGRYEFGWLDEAMDLLHTNGIRVDLATATASPPAWLVAKHPEMLPVDHKGHTLHFGGRQSWSLSSQVYREYSLTMTRAIAERYRDHPALAMWHVSNELGCHNSRDYSEETAREFRRWLQERHGTLEELNHAWGTAFWSQNYTDWEQVGPPRHAPTFPNPTQQLDFARFCSDMLLGQYLAEREILREVTPNIPVTTNFMVMGITKNMDYARWAKEVDFVSNDHYLAEGDPEPQIELAFSADICRGIAGGEPWMVMEHSTSAVNWGSVNRAKKPGEMLRNSLANVARGADGISFFQWRASRAGAEKFHSAMLPHAGEDTRVFREVAELGAALESLAPVVGSTVRNRVALVFDWPSWWASELDSHPSQRFNYRQTVMRHYRTLWRANVPVDVVPVDGIDPERHDVVLAPALYLVDDDAVERLSSFTAAGGILVTTYFSGVVDGNDHIRTGAEPDAFQRLLGVRPLEWRPLRGGHGGPIATGDAEGGRTGAETDADLAEITLDNGWSAGFWTEDLQILGDVEVVASYRDSAVDGGALAGRPAVTRNSLPQGQAWYLSTELDDEALAEFLLETVGLKRYAEPVLHGALEVVRRHAGDGREFLFAVNHSDEHAAIAAAGTELITGEDLGVDPVKRTVPAGSVRVFAL